MRRYNEAHFLANWRWFIQWNLKLQPAVVVAQLDIKQRRSGETFDCYGFYRAVVERGGYLDDANGKKNISMPQVYREMANHRDGQGLFASSSSPPQSVRRRLFLEHHPCALVLEPAP